MLTSLILMTCLGQVAAEKMAGPAPELPKPHYRQLPDDPLWLVQAVQFHGHLGPMAVAGVRFGMAGLRAVGAQGFFDVEITCEGPFPKPPPSCFLDGLQVGSGATLGKRTLNWTPADKIVVHVKNTKTGKTAELRPTPRLLQLLDSLKGRPKKTAASEEEHGQDDHGQTPVETLARKIAAMGEAELIQIK